MAKPITPYSLVAPGYYGLNTQDGPVDIDSRFCLEANNCVFDKYGRVGSRKGWSAAHASNANLGNSDITVIGEVVQNDGTRTTVAAGGGFLFTHSGSTLTTLTYGGGGVAPTISDNNWQFVQLGGVGVFFQRGYDPLIFDPAVSTTTFRRVSEKAGYSGSIPLANCAVSAFGRIWCADTTTDKNTITFSDLLTTHNWTGGSSGTLNLLGVWPSGGDEIVALASHNNQLIIFGKKQTLIYTGATTPSSMTLYDTLDNIGCVARDSVQDTGDDIVFLSDTGVRSLRRTIQEKSAPTRSLSKNVFNDIQSYMTAETLENVKSGYSPVDGIYVITFPASFIAYCFDMKAVLPDGAARVTTWTGIKPKCFAYLKSRKFYLGQPGYIGEYTGYLDNASTYTMTYYTAWVDFGNQIQISILKKIIASLVFSRDQQLTFKWGFDYAPQTSTNTATIVGIGTAAEYNIAEYGIAEYGSNIAVNTVSMNAGGHGRVIQVGIEALINNSQVSIQRVDIFTKDGRI